MLERRALQVVELVAALLAGADEAGLLEHREVLRDRLPRRAEPVLGGQPRAELEQRLPVPLPQLVQDRAARGRRERLSNAGVRFTQAPTEMGPGITTAVLDDTCGNLIQIASTP